MPCNFVAVIFTQINFVANFVHAECDYKQYSLYCFFHSFTYTLYLSVCMFLAYVYGPCCLILNKMMMMIYTENGRFACLCPLWSLRNNYNIHLKLTGKRIVDFLLNFLR